MSAQKLTQLISISLGGRMDGRTILVQCYRNLLEMVDNRGLRLVHSCQTTHDLLATIQNAAEVLTAVGQDDTQLHIYVDTEERTGVKWLRQLREKHSPEDNLMIVNVDGPTPFTRKEVGGANVEFWMVRELLINPTRHHLVPPHRLMSEDEVEALKTRRSVSEHQWPLIQSNDIIVRWYRFPKDGIVHIERRGIAHERGDYYRKVV